MLPPEGLSVTIWTLRGDHGAEVSIALDGLCASDLNALATLQRQQGKVVIAEILDLTLNGRLHSEKYPSKPRADSSLDADATVVQPRLLDGLQRAAAAAGQNPGAYGAAIVAQFVHGMSRTIINPSCGGLFASDDAKVQIWMPEQVRTALQAFADLLGISASDVVRSSVFAHLYGRLAYERAVRAAIWKPARRHPEVQFSEQRSRSPDEESKAPRTVLIAQIGKSNRQFTAMMPSALKAELAAAAERRGMRSSEYLRRHLATYLLGRSAVDALPPQAEG